MAWRARPVGFLQLSSDNRTKTARTFERLRGSPLVWRLGWLASALAIAAVETMPWSNFQGHSHWAKVCWVPFRDRQLNGFGFDVCQNIVLFLPFGFTAIHTRKRKNFLAAARIVMMGAFFSASGELFQVYCHNRFPSMTDVTTNTVGTLIGVLVGLRW